MRARSLRAVVIALAIGLFAILVSWQGHHIRVELVMSSTAPGPAEVFFAGDGGFTAGDSISVPTTGDGVVHRYEMELLSRDSIKRLRLDPAIGPGVVELRRMSLRGKVMGIPSPRIGLALPAEGYNELDAVSLPDGGWRLTARGTDPYVEITLPRDALEALARHRLHATAVFGALVALIAWLVVAFSALARPLARRVPGLVAPVAHQLRRLGRHASDPGAIRFGATATAFLLACVVGAGSGVAFKLNQSSVAMWNAYLPQSGKVETPLLGSARAVRSDEWLVTTPWMLSQASRGLPLSNSDLGGSAAPLLASMPVAHPVAWAQPEFWGFALFGPERAVSWFFMFKLFGLLGSGFLLLMLLTRNDAVVSALGAIWLCFSSFTQWWFSSNLPEILIGFNLTMCGFLYVCGATRIGAQAAGAVMLVLGASTFALQLYPPFQVPLVYLGAAIAVGWMLEPAARARLALHAPRRIALLFASAVAIGLVLWLFFMDARDTVAAVTQTAYPGTRLFVGGLMPWWGAFDGIFEAWRIGDQVFPNSNLNASETSDYVVLFPLVAIVLLANLSRARHAGMAMAIAAYCFLLGTWMVVTLPGGWAETLSRATLLSYVSPLRATSALGAASILLFATYMAWRARQGTAERIAPKGWMAIAFAALLTFQFGSWLSRIDPDFITGWRVMLGCLVAGLAMAALVTGRRGYFAALVALVAIPAMTVNPLSRGLGPLLDNEAILAAKRDDDNSRWLVVGSFVLPQAFKANGLATFGGATYLPDVQRMRNLDPADAHVAAWNRYAHIQVESVPGIATPEFQLLQADQYNVRIDVCRDAARALGVDRVAYAGPVPEADRACLQPSPRAPVGGITLFRLLPRPAGQAMR